MPYLSASAAVIHYEEALYEVYACTFMQVYVIQALVYSLQPVQFCLIVIVNFLSISDVVE